jgi:hypothetical protein
VNDGYADFIACSVSSRKSTAPPRSFAAENGTMTLEERETRTMLGSSIFFKGAFVGGERKTINASGLPLLSHGREAGEHFWNWSALTARMSAWVASAAGPCRSYFAAAPN